MYIYICVRVCVCVCCTVRRPSCYFSLIANTGFNSRFDSRSTRVVMSSMVVVARERHTMTYLLIHEIEILRTWIQRSDSRLFPSSPVVIRTCTHVYRRTHADEHGFRRARGQEGKTFRHVSAMCSHVSTPPTSVGLHMSFIFDSPFHLHSVTCLYDLPLSPLPLSCSSHTYRYAFMPLRDVIHTGSFSSSLLLLVCLLPPVPIQRVIVIETNHRGHIAQERIRVRVSSLGRFCLAPEDARHASHEGGLPTAGIRGERHNNRLVLRAARYMDCTDTTAACDLSRCIVSHSCMFPTCFDSSSVSDTCGCHYSPPPLVPFSLARSLARGGLALCPSLLAQLNLVPRRAWRGKILSPLFLYPTRQICSFLRARHSWRGKFTVSPFFFSVRVPPCI